MFRHVLTRVVLAVVALSAAGCAADDLEDDFGAESSAVKKKKPKKDEDKPAPAPKPQARARFKVITQNIGGGINNGSAAAVDYLTDQARSWGPDVVMLQEVCEGQLDVLKARFKEWDFRYSAMIPKEERCGNRAIGIVLASRNNLSDLAVTDLGEAFGRHFTMVCADVKFEERAHSVRACVTHLRAWDDAEADPMRAKQTALIDAELDGRIKQDGQAVIVAGDFNAGPKRPALDSMYRQKISGQMDGKGLFREADQNDKSFFRDPMAPEVQCAPDSCRAGEGTHGGAKLDHIFFSINRANADVNGEVMAAGKSDHNLYRGWADLDM